MPRSTLLPTLALTLALLVPMAIADQVPEPLHGKATLKAFSVRSNGMSRDLEGGVADYTLLCTDCTLNLTVNSTGLVVVQNGAQVPLAVGGIYQVREFAGVFSWTRVALGNYTVTIEGEGRVLRVA